MSDKREAFETQAQHIIQEAWHINGEPGISDDIAVQLRILNGLLAMAIAEVLAPPKTPSPIGYDLVRLGRDVLDGPVEGTQGGETP